MPTAELRASPVVDGKPMKPGEIDPGFDAFEYDACLKDCYVIVRLNSSGLWAVFQHSSANFHRRGSALWNRRGFKDCYLAAAAIDRRLAKWRGHG